MTAESQKRNVYLEVELKVKKAEVLLLSFQYLGLTTVNYDQLSGDCEDRGNKKNFLNNFIETCKKNGENNL